MKRNKPPLLYEAMGNISDVYISEASDAPTVDRKRTRMIACLAACLALLVIFPTVALIASFQNPLRRYQDDPYYNVIASIVQQNNEAEYLAKLQKKNFFERISEMFWNVAGAKATDVDNTGTPSSGVLLDSSGNSSDTDGDKDNITDNQVAGVLEADIIKRNDTHIFYLNGNTLKVYTLAGEESEQIASIALASFDDETSYANFYLAENRLILEGVHHKEDGVYTRLITLSIDDILDGRIDAAPSRVTLQGSLISTRFAEGNLLVMCGYYYYGEPDFKTDGYLPHYESADGMAAISADCITAPDGPSESFYTTVYLLNGETLAVKDAHALLGTPTAQYVSNNAVYLVSESEMLCTENGEAVVFEYEFNKERSCLKTKTVSHIEAISYSDEGFTVLGSVTLDGSVKDQYSMDEHEGVLRVATSTSEWSYVLNERETRINFSSRERNASLYLISLEDFSVLSSAQKFAPFGETVQSVRFDETLAYICTAEIVTFTDPVYRFDLSDPERIHSLDTGTIDGYSTSLVELENGDLLGIGYGADTAILKLEIYRKSEESLVSVACYELSGCVFSEDYKSYYINREDGLFGVPVYCYSEKVGGVTYYESRMHYLLFSYDGEALTVSLDLILGDSYVVDQVRGFVHEGYCYVLFRDGIKVALLGCATNS